MPSLKADLMLHPIRFRIVTAISSSQMSARDIAAQIPDVPQTTLYRHINALLEGGILKIVGEKQIRGTVERTYALSATPSLTSEDLRGMSRHELEQAFTMFLSSLMIDAQRYLAGKPERVEIDPIADGVRVSKAQLYLNEAEFENMNQAIFELILAGVQNQPGAGRNRRVFSCTFFPVEDGPALPGQQP